MNRRRRHCCGFDPAQNAANRRPRASRPACRRRSAAVCPKDAAFRAKGVGYTLGVFDYNSRPRTKTILID
ncbi:hypothetical protein AMC87_PD00280 (plasmid) [Rhizobium phaseoli]|nr:hypothetical protein AMC87_PD00280 [Rhizobium phaseoli]EGE59482.1 hypothetical protein RHECNPAF_2190084 [Rhizobium etli CNPAF512]